jgi:hypothetical protein
MGWQGRAAIRSRAVLLLALFVVSVAAKSTDQTQGDAEDAVPESTKKGADLFLRVGFQMPCRL